MLDLVLDQSLDDVHESEQHHGPDHDHEDSLDEREPDDCVVDVVTTDEVGERDVHVEILHLRSEPDGTDHGDPSEDGDDEMQRVRLASPDRQADQQEASTERQLRCPYNPRRVHSSSLGVVVVV